MGLVLLQDKVDAHEAMLNDLRKENVCQVADRNGSKLFLFMVILV